MGSHERRHPGRVLQDDPQTCIQNGADSPSFELKGWTETKVVVRFWMIELIFVLLALTIFYGDWVTRSGLLFS